jgi:hypothetical protein
MRTQSFDMRICCHSSYCLGTSSIDHPLAPRTHCAALEGLDQRWNYVDRYFAFLMMDVVWESYRRTVLISDFSDVYSKAFCSEPIS